MRSLKNLSPRTLLLLQLAAFWPAWKWMAWRLTSCPNEIWEMLPLIAVGGILFLRARTGSQATPPNLLLPTMLTLFYAATFGVLPDLPRTAIAFTALAATLSVIYMQRPFHIGLWGLLLLSLQLQNGLQFYLGYPLRVLAAVISAPLLRLSGFNVVADGTCLNWGGELVLIDAPCSGIKMLWAGMFLAFLLAAVNNFNWLRSAIVCVSAVAVVILANILRATALFYVEAGVIDVPAWTHTGVGVLMFALTAVCIVLCADKIQKGVPCAAHSS